MKAVNLIPAEQRGGSARGAGRSQGGAYAVLGVLAGLALLALVYGMARHQVSSREAKAVTLEARVQRVQADASRLAPYSSFVALRDQRVQAVSQLVNSRFDWAHAFHELGRVVPANVSITSVSGTIGAAGGPSGSAASPAPAAPAAGSTPAAAAGSTPAAAASGGSAAGSASKAASSASSVASSTPPGSVPAFTIGGCAKSQSIVALTLDRLRLIDGVSTVTLQSSTKPAGTGGSSGAGGSSSCPSSYPVFSMQVEFDPLPASSATSKPAVGAPVSSKRGATKSTGGS